MRAIVVALLHALPSDASVLTAQRATVMVRRAPAGGAGRSLLPLSVATALDTKHSLVVVLLPDLPTATRFEQEWAFFERAAWSTLTVSRGSEGALDEEAVRTLASVEGRRVVFSSYSSAGALDHALDAAGAPVDLLVCDSASGVLASESTAAAAAARAQRSVQFRFLNARRRLFVKVTSRTRLETDICRVDDDGAWCGPVAYRLPAGGGGGGDGGGDGERAGCIGIATGERFISMRVSEAIDRLAEQSVPLDGLRQRRAAPPEYADLAVAATYIFEFVEDSEFEA